MRSIVAETFNCSRTDVFRLYPLSDVHFGSAACDEVSLRATVAEVATNRRFHRWVDVGDSIEAVRPGDKRFDPRQVAPWVDLDDLANISYVQADRYADVVEPVAAQCWGKGMGNHEATIINRDGFNPHYHVVQRLARGSQKPHKRLDLDYCGVLVLKFYRSEEAAPARVETVKVMVWHGAGGGRLLPESKLRSLLGAYDVDVLLTGHVHKAGYVLHDVMGWNNTTGEREMRRRTAVVCGTYARSFNPADSGPTYGEVAGYAPADSSGVVVEIAPFARDAVDRVRVVGAPRLTRDYD